MPSNQATDLQFPETLSLGGRLGGAPKWRIAGTLLLVGDDSLDITLNLTTHRFAERFFFCASPPPGGMPFST